MREGPSTTMLGSTSLVWCSRTHRIRTCCCSKINNRLDDLKREVALEGKDHTHLVGCIVTNLQALETVLRYFLLRVHKQDPQFPKVGDTDASVYEMAIRPIY